MKLESAWRSALADVKFWALVQTQADGEIG
jgi:hypothetical protein